MRLIDADALIEGYKHMGYDPTEHPEESYMEGWCKGFNSATDHCIHHVIHAPTIEERKTGKWIEAGKQMIVNLENAREQYAALGYPHRNELKLQCSCCRKITMVDESIAYNFCPHCGADMRQGGQE